MRIYLYHFPQQSAVPITLSLIARLLKAFPGVIKGAKDSSGDFANTSAMVREFAQDGFEVYGADDSRLQDLLKLGGAGGITAAANVSSAMSAKVYADLDGPGGASAQTALATVRKAVTSVPLISGTQSPHRPGVPGTRPGTPCCHPTSRSRPVMLRPCSLRSMRAGSCSKVCVSPSSPCDDERLWLMSLAWWTTQTRQRNS